MQRDIQFVLIVVASLITSPGLCAKQTFNNSQASDQTHVEDRIKWADFVVRFGMGGFNDSRSPENKLGGDQIAFDVKLRAIPLAVSITSEYYTNSANPTHSYEIESLIAVNLLYHSHFKNLEKLNYFLGGGFGRLKVPKEESNPEKLRSGELLNLEAGLNYLAFDPVGFYGAVKYLRAEKTENNLKVIDFNETIFLLGISVNFSY